ncbi:nucleotidyltransferase domain-containing protein [Candidatus Woesearchaeota archaeon]|nr:nucleotidyltransferase domain-containing protein [Candidatus Woesearchaeota archaeon]
MKPEMKIFLAYLTSRKSKLYFNELKELTGLSDSSLDHNLKKLVSNNILSIDKTKSNTFYILKNKRLVSLKFSELSLSKFDDLNRGVRVPLQNFLSKLPRTIFSVVLFGSASRKEEQKNSDIDLLIISNEKPNLNPLRKDSEIISNYPLNIFYCSIQDFIDTTDHIVIQAKKTGFPVFGEQNFYEVLLNKNS